MAIKMQIRRGTFAAWNAAGNPVLLPGELGFVTDVGKTAFKIGNTAGDVWNDLPYVNSTYPELDVSAGNNLNTSLAQGRYPLLSGSAYTNVPGDFTNTTTDGSSILLVTVPTNNIIIQELTTSLTPCKRWIRAYNGTPAVWTAWKRIDTLSATESLSITNLTLSGALTTLGSMGVGTASPQQRLDVNGNITSNRTAAGSFVVSGDGAYTFGTDVKQYIYGTPGNGGTIGLYASNAGGTSAQVLGVNSAGVTITGTITLPAGSVAGAALANNGVTVGKLAQVSVPSFLGTPSGTASATNVSALTQAQAQTMLDLTASAYTDPIITSNVFVNTSVSGNATIFQDFDVSTLPVGVIQCLPITLARAANSGFADVYCRVIMESLETLLVFGGFDIDSVVTFGAPNEAYWYWNNELWTAGTSQQGRFVPMYYVTGTTPTVNVFRWSGGTGQGGVIQVNAALVVMRIS